MPGLAPLHGAEMPQGIPPLEQLRLPVLHETHAALNVLKTGIGTVLPIVGVAALVAGGIYTIVRGDLPPPVKSILGSR